MPVATSTDQTAEAEALALCRTAHGRPAGEARAIYARALAIAPECLDAICGTADGLLASGCFEEAAAWYRKALGLRPGHPVAANNLGNALQKLGRFHEAAACYRSALAARPDSVPIRVNLGRALDAAGQPREALEEFGKALAQDPTSADIHWRIGTILENIPFLDEARGFYERALELDPEHAAAHIGLGTVLIDLGCDEAAWAHLAKGYADNVLATVPAVHNPDPTRVLKLVSAAGGNVPLDPVLTADRFAVSRLVVEFAGRLPAVESFDLVVNAIGDADRCREGLRAAARLLEDCPLPVINPPARIVGTTREDALRRLGSLPDVRAPRVATLPRAVFEAGRGGTTLAAEGWRCPLLLRVLGHHTGHHFVRVESLGQVDAAALALPGHEITAIQWLAPRRSDGKFRKYRVMYIGGEVYPLHLAVSDHWKVHYFTANMADDAAYRAEERQFLSDPASVVGAKGAQALRAIQARLGLDYGGIDFAIGAAGEILVFEANAAMRIVAPQPDPIWDYRRPFIDRALAAAKALCERRGRRS